MVAINIITSFIILYISVKRIKRKERIELISILSISYALLYFLVPAIVFSYGNNYKRKIDLLGYIVYNSSNNERLLIYGIGLLSYIMIIFPSVINKNVNWNSNGHNYYIDKEKAEHITRKFYLFSLILGCIGFCGMAANIGVNGFINFSGSLRDSIAEAPEVSGLFSYFNIMSKYLIAAMAPGILLYELNHSKRLKNELYIIFLCSILIELYNAGKTNFILFLMPLGFYFFCKKGKINIKHLLMFGILVIILVPLFDNLFYYISRGESVEKYRSDWTLIDYVNSISRQFIYPYANLVNADEMNQYYGYRMFLDYATFVNLIPAKLLGGFQLNTLYHLTTDYYQGQFGFTAGVPNDFIFFSYRQLGIISVIILSLFRGMIIKYIDLQLGIVKKAFDKEAINSMHLVSSCCFITVLFTLLEPLSAFYSQPILFISIFMMLLIRKKCVK